MNMGVSSQIKKKYLPKFTGETYNFFQVFWKKYNFMHFERQNAFQNAYYCFSEKKLVKKYKCLPYLKFSDLLPETHLFFYLASSALFSEAFLFAIRRCQQLWSWRDGQFT